MPITVFLRGEGKSNFLLPWSNSRNIFDGLVCNQLEMRVTTVGVLPIRNACRRHTNVTYDTHEGQGQNGH